MAETEIERWRRILCEAAETWVLECRTENRQIAEWGRNRVLDAALVYGAVALDLVGSQLATAPSPDVPQPPAVLPRPDVSPDADEVLAGPPLMNLNPEPLKIVKVPVCRRCRMRAPWCSCGAADYELAIRTDEPREVEGAS